MLAYLSSSIWASPAQILVNTVNVVGAMGKCFALDEVEKAKAAEGTRKQEEKTI